MRTSLRYQSLLVVLLTTCVCGGVALKVGATRKKATALSTSVVISQIYGGGGNTNATLRNDFIELFNPTGSSVDISNWSVQYAPATSSSWQVTNLCASAPCVI